MAPGGPKRHWSPNRNDPDRQGVRKAYGSLRGTAEKHVIEALPRVGALVQKPAADLHIHANTLPYALTRCDEPMNTWLLPTTRE